ncbi:TIGR04255 family protein [Arthrobacter sp.]|uniref:TIGR04255 family protein n=1 Tax=Arthrobacter sp. TaxID=1667 RepID=UPI003A923840
MNPREVYPNAPLVSVSFELRHPESEMPTSKQRSLFKDLIREHLPVMRIRQSTVQTFEIGPAGPSHQVVNEDVPKYFNRENTMAVSLLKGSTLVETTDYPGWEKFREIVSAACQARDRIGGIDGIERIGLRYIDEIRIPGTNATPDWKTYLNESLLGPRDGGGAGMGLQQWQGMAVYGPESGRSLVLRYASGDGFAADPNGELRRKSPSYPGPFFLLDIDSFWIPESGFPEFSDSLLLAEGDALHAPVRQTFENLITDQLRNEVLRK